jgi:hypothetical protein
MGESEYKEPDLKSIYECETLCGITDLYKFIAHIIIRLKFQVFFLQLIISGFFSFEYHAAK